MKKHTQLLKDAAEGGRPLIAPVSLGGPATVDSHRWPGTLGTFFHRAPTFFEATAWQLQVRPKGQRGPRPWIPSDWLSFLIRLPSAPGTVVRLQAPWHPRIGSRRPSGSARTEWIEGVGPAVCGPERERATGGTGLPNCWNHWPLTSLVDKTSTRVLFFG